MSRPPLDDDEYRRWREEADRALESARRESGAGAHNWSCGGSAASRYRAADSAEAVADAERVLAFIDRSWNEPHG